jgi:hypothetical protein
MSKFDARVTGSVCSRRGFIAALPAAERAKIDGEVHALIAAESSLNGNDVVTVPYETAAFFTVKE